MIVHTGDPPDNDIITVSELEIGKGSTFQIKINKLQVPSDVAHADIYTWTTTMATGTTSPVALAESPKLYVVRESNQGLGFAANFEIVDNAFDTGGGLRVDFPRYNAASKQHIRFKFDLIGTPIKSGSIWFDIPKNWAAPSLTDVEGKATVDLIVTKADDSGGAS